MHENSTKYALCSKKRLETHFLEREVLMSKINVRRYTTATFLFPGALFPNKVSYEVPVKDPLVIAKAAPQGAFCFFLKDWIEKRVVVDGETFEKTERDGSTSGRYYLGGTVYTLTQFKEKFGDDPDKRILVSNAEGNGWRQLIQCNAGNWQPFRDVDELLAVA